MTRKNWEKMKLEKLIENISTYGDLTIFVSILNSPMYYVAYENEVLRKELSGNDLAELLKSLRDNFED